MPELVCPYTIHHMDSVKSNSWEVVMATERGEANCSRALKDRVWHQVRHGIDKERLLPSLDKQRRDLEKKLDRELDRNGWRIFVSAQVHAMKTAKAPGRRRAEVMLIESIQRWGRQVQQLLPHRVQDLVNLVEYGMDHPEPTPQKTKE